MTGSPAVATITAKGQITIPKAIRVSLGLEPGDQVEFVREADGVRIQRRRGSVPFSHYRGFLKNLAGRDTDEILEDMRGR